MPVDPQESALAPISATVLCGFLGSGKTTRINRLISSGGLENALFLVNDFGRINIDAELIESRTQDIVRLTNGCACCGIAGDFSAQLRNIKQWRERPTHLVLEASGVARPRPLMQLFDAARGYRLAHAETLIDASAFARHHDDAAINDILVAQIREVAALRVNRIDWLDEASAAAVRQAITDLNPTADITIEQASGPAPEAAPACAARPHAGALVTESVTWNRPIAIGALESLLVAAAPEVVRAKGLVQATDYAGTCYVVQLAGGRVSCVAARARNTRALVLIGYRGNALDRLLAALHEL